MVTQIQGYSRAKRRETTRHVEQSLVVGGSGCVRDSRGAQVLQERRVDAGQRGEEDGARRAGRGGNNGGGRSGLGGVV